MDMYALIIVDDERRIVRGLTQALQNSGLALSEVQGFHSAHEVLKAMERQPYDILLSDIRMPEMDGLALIAEVKKLQPACRVVFLTGFGQFEYAQQAVKLGAFDFLLKPVTDEHLFHCLERVICSLDEERAAKQSIDRLKSRYEETVPMLRSAFLKQLAEGQLARLQPEERLERSLSLNVPLDLEQAATWLLVRVDNRQKMSAAYTDSEIDVLLETELEKALAPDFRYAAHWDSHGFLVCATQPSTTGASQEERGRLRLAVEQLRDRLLTDRGIELSVLLSRRATDFSDWPEAYKVAARLLRQHIRSVGGFVLDAETESESAGRESSGFAGLTAVSSLDLLLESGNETEYYRRLAIAFDEARASPGMPYRVFAEICQNISLSLIKTLNKLNLTDEEQSSLDIDDWANVNRISSVEEMSERFAGASAKVFELLKRRRDESRDAVSRAKWHIAQNLDGDLSLTRLSEACHMSSPYLSRIFKEQTGEGINHYITRLRIERAMELLHDPSLKIADVAVRSGYDNIPYFTKVFKKVVGVTPQEYKKI